MQTVKKDSTNEVEKIICEEKDNDHQVTKTSPVKTTADSTVFSAAFTLPAVTSPEGAAPHWGEAVRLPAPGGFQGGQWQSSEYTVLTFMRIDPNISTTASEKLQAVNITMILEAA